MLGQVLKKYYRVLVTCGKSFSIFSEPFLKIGIFTGFWLLFTHFFLFLDNIFFPKYRKVPIVKPVFIVGHPRSGTSLLHRLLGEHPQSGAFKLWQIENPSLTARYFLKPYIDYRIRKGKKSYIYLNSSKDTGRQISPTDVEHEEFLYFPILDTQLAFIFYALALDEKPHDELVYCDDQPYRRESVRFLKGCLQRQLYYTGAHQAIIHAHYSTLRLKTLLEEFPDAKFIYLVRSPYETIASHSSLHLKGLLSRYGKASKIGLDLSQGTVRSYFQRRYRYDCDLYRYAEQFFENQIPADRLRVVKYDDLIGNMKETVCSLLDFAQLPPDEELTKKLEAKIANQKNYKRKHKVEDLEFFGLTKEQVYQDLSFVFDKYHLDK